MARLKNGSRWYGNRGVCTNHHHHHNQLSPTIYTTNPIAPLSIIYHKHIHSPIIHHSTQQDIQETKQMLIMEQDMVDITMDHIHSSWQNQWKQWQEWQEFQEWKQFKQYKQWRDSTGREYSTGNENITSISTNSSNIYNNNMWNENDIMSTTTETTISNKNKQNNNRFKRVNNKLYEPIRESQEHNIESYTKQLYTTNNNTNKTTSIITNT
eukprot:835992_1